jgi:hypothetical protein
MASPFTELEVVLTQLVAEHHKLLASLDAQQAAMRTLDVQTMERVTAAQEASRLRIASLDHRRRTLVLQIAKMVRLEEKQLTLRRLADLHPPRKAQLMALRAELTDVCGKIGERTQITGRVASAVLGHLNTVMRIVTGAVEKAGLYTRQGVPRVSARIGVMEAVG